MYAQGLGGGPPGESGATHAEDTSAAKEAGPRSVGWARVPSPLEQLPPVEDLSPLPHADTSCWFTLIQGGLPALFLVALQ